MTKISTFDDWIDYFHHWHDDIGFPTEVLGGYDFKEKLDELQHDEIEFGDFAGEKKWERVTQIPDQRIRDALEHLIVYQGDTEFASVEQQRNLVNSAPNEYDLNGLIRVMAEEMRHGWQMCYLLVKYFGHSGKIEAQKLLERRSFKHNRLLGSFNEDVDNWLDFFVYTEFVDRDGKFQLKMLSRSGFAPLARSMGPMLKEESYHLGTGHNGLRRVLQAGKIPIEIVQKYFNKWLPTAYDLFGKDDSSSANWAYVYGLKGRYDEDMAPDPVDKDHLNERSREQYHEEVIGLIDNLNNLVPNNQQRLYAPDLKFNRAIGNYAGETFDVVGEKVSPEEYSEYAKRVLPVDRDKKVLGEIFKQKDWIVPKKSED